MTTRKPTDTKRDDLLPGDASVIRAYRAAAKNEPPAALDAKILTEAQRAVAKPKARGPFAGRWAIPLSTAAIIVLSLGVVLLLSERGALNHRDDRVALLSEAPSPELARKAPAASLVAPEPALSAAKKSAKAKPALPETVQGLVAPSPAPEEEKAERNVTPSAAAPMMQERMTDEHVAAARDKVRAPTTLAKKEDSNMSVTANVISVQASGQAGAYQFNVSIRSPDKGCAQYADWWEVVSTDGKLLYRRVLLHSHVDEQPFTRSGGPVPIQADTTVWVRAHMNTSGYGGIAFKGSVKTGFKPSPPDAEFAADLAKQAPLPDNCDF